MTEKRKVICTEAIKVRPQWTTNWLRFHILCKQRYESKLFQQAMHCIIKTHTQKAWDDGVAPGVKVPGGAQPRNCIPQLGQRHDILTPYSTHFKLNPTLSSTQIEPNSIPP